MKKILISKVLLISILFRLSGQNTYEFVLNADKIGAKVNPNLYGVFFEDINFGADGGLYAELIKNRSFEFDFPFTGWLPYGSVKILDNDPCFDKNPHYAQLSYDKEVSRTGMENFGFRGIGLLAKETYRLTVYARCKETPIDIKVELVNSGNTIVLTDTLSFMGTQWKKYSKELIPKSTDAHCSIRLTMITRGVVDIDHISLFPEKTFKNRENGLRNDLACAVSELKPGVMRFPGGCVVEGLSIAGRYQWKNTVGPVENRPQNINIWNFVFSRKRTSDYYQSYGLGFFEYFQFCEDIGAEPLPVLNCGISCQFNNKDPKENCPVDQLQPYVDDAVDLIEFANGSSVSPWGKIRANMGHPQPFNLKYLAIGNEQWGTLYAERFDKFVKVLRAKCPDIKIIGSAGQGVSGARFDSSWVEMRKQRVDLVDEHFYKSPDWFKSNARRYDNYDRKGPKVYLGEYASQSNTFNSALAEAAFLTGIERNADVVTFATYAPLFAHMDAWQWRPDLIWFDNLRCVKSVNWYVQELYSKYKGTNVIPITWNDSIVAGQDNLYASAVIEKSENEIYIKVVNTNSSSRDLTIKLPNVKVESPSVKVITLSGELKSENTLDNPFNTVPVESSASIVDKVLKVSVKANSFNIIVIKM